jgi:hypothetical protein
MQPTPHSCPHCRERLWIGHDMWGPYYVCDDCGWTAEDDEVLVDESVREGLEPPVFTLAEPGSEPDSRRHLGL